MSQFQIQSLTGAIGEALNSFGGLRQTRLLYAVAVGATSVVVEHSYDWPAASGRVVIDGVTYHYTANDLNGALSGLYVVSGGVNVSGTQIAHSAGATVVDTSQTHSAIDLVRRAMLVDYAEGDDLSALGRNLGVLRLPTLKSDDQFRSIVRALAYNPKGTMYGLTLAMDALVGPGNYKITEDLLAAPCTITVSVPGSIFLDTFPQGKSYLTGPTNLTAASGSLPSVPLASGQTYARMASLTLVEELFITLCKSARPSADSQAYYPGGTAAQLWTYVGSAETTNVTLATQSSNPLGASFASNAQCYYQHAALTRPEGNTARLALVCSITTPLNLTSANYFFASLSDGAHQYSLALTLGAGSVVYLLLFDGDPAGSPAVIGQCVWPGGTVEVVLGKRGKREIFVLLNGAKVLSSLYTAFTSTDTTSLMRFGSLKSVAGSSIGLVVRQAAIETRCSTDYWSAQNADGSVSGQTLTTPSLTSAGTDVGKQMRTTGSLVTNAQKGNNNGVFAVQAASGTTWTLQCPQLQNAQTSSLYTQRVVVNNTDSCFTFPDDLGKSLTIENSALGNNGTYVITKLLDPYTLTDLSAAATTVTSYTNICEMQSATLTAETGLNIHLTPNFVTESSLAWELSDAGTVALSGGALTITPRQPLPFPAGAYALEIENVLSAQALAVSAVLNYNTAVGPPALFTYWPFYVLDPYYAIETYLSQIVAAGVSINFVFT